MSWSWRCYVAAGWQQQSDWRYKLAAAAAAVSSRASSSHGSLAARHLLTDDFNHSRGLACAWGPCRGRWRRERSWGAMGGMEGRAPLCAA